MEIFSLKRLLDPLRTGEIEKRIFVREMNLYSHMFHEVDIDREIISFRAILKHFKIDPILAYQIADNNDYKRVSKDLLIETIVKLAPLINPHTLNHFFSHIFGH